MCNNYTTFKNTLLRQVSISVSLLLIIVQLWITVNVPSCKWKMPPDESPCPFLLTWLYLKVLFTIVTLLFCLLKYCNTYISATVLKYIVCDDYVTLTCTNNSTISKNISLYFTEERFCDTGICLWKLKCLMCSMN